MSRKCDNKMESGERELMDDYLALDGVAGFSFLGRPLPGTLRRASSAEASYKASFETGSIPNWKILCFVVFAERPSFSAISLIVKNSSPLINIILSIGRCAGTHKKYNRRVEIVNAYVVKTLKKLKKIPSGYKYILKKIPSGYIIKP
jgi:hypothetical protein